MDVETYEQTEISSETGKPECTEEQIALAQSLGLEGQQKFISKQDGETPAKFFPYRHMTAVERNVYGELLQSRTPAKDYDAGPIPVRVMQVIAHVREFEDDLIGNVQIWYEPTIAGKDQILVAGDAYNYGTWFLLARWGEELRPFEELLKRARDKARDRYVGALRGIKAQVVVDLAVAESTPVDELMGRSTPSYHSWS